MEGGLWIMLGAAALLLRAGYALYLSGISRSKNTAASLFRSVAAMAMGILAFWAIGEWIVFYHRPGAAGGAMPHPEMLFMAAVVLIGSAVISGATLERSRFAVTAAAAILMSGVLTPLAWRLAWSHRMEALGFTDVAGATFIHFAAGICALVAVLVVGARTGKYNRDGSTNGILGHNLSLACAGLFVIFAAWIPYVGGCTILRGGGASAAGLNVILGGSAGAVAAMCYCKFHYAKFDVFLVYAGLLAGLVSVTAGADRIAAHSAVVCGLVAGVLVPAAIIQIDLVWKIDDPAAGIAIHGLGGLWSALAAGLFVPGTVWDHLHRLAAQCLGLALIGVLSVALSGLVWLGLRATARLRPDEADEFEGLDLAEHDLNAYPDFQQTMIKSYHLREM